MSRAQIARVAIALADSEGLEAISMRRLAAKLGSAATSLYSYVANKSELYELVVDEVIGEIPLPEQPSGDWRTDLHQLAIDTHTVLSRHSWAILLGIQPGLGPKTRRYSERAFACLHGLGLDQWTTANILAALNNYLFGFVHREVAWDELTRRSGLSEQQWLDRLEAVQEDGEEDTQLQRLIATRLRLRAPESFEFGLDCFLDGIASRVRV
jgi:AcrR family transcriptional regulator